MGSVIAAVAGLILAGLSTFGIVTVVNNGSAPVPGANDGTTIVYGSTN